MTTTPLSIQTQHATHWLSDLCLLTVFFGYQALQSSNCHRSSGVYAGEDSDETTKTLLHGFSILHIYRSFSLSYHSKRAGIILASLAIIDRRVSCNNTYMNNYQL